MNLAFIEECDRLRILILILPPHSTHRLQPLNVGLFSPLARFYTNGRNNLTSNSLGLIGMSKRSFWAVFWPAWKQAFTKKNVDSAFQKTGIFPLNPAIVLDLITKSEPVRSSQLPKTPTSCRAVRQVHRQFRNSPSELILQKILRANKRLAAANSIEQHLNKALQDAIKNERKRRKRGKRLNLLGEEASGAQFFSPAQVQRARAWQVAKDNEEAQRQQGIIDRKALTAAKKQQREKEKAERAAAATEKRRVAAETKAAKQAEKQAQKEMKEAASRQIDRQSGPRGKSKGSKGVQKTLKKQAKQPRSGVIARKKEEGVMAASRGRRVQKPQRFFL